jgi:hypothetical protein
MHSRIPQGQAREKIIEAINAIGRAAGGALPQPAATCLRFAALWCCGNCTDAELAAYAVAARDEVYLYAPAAKRQRDFLWAAARVAAAAALADPAVAAEAVQRIESYLMEAAANAGSGPA